MISVYLHIGMGKTGTSVIQNFLDMNRFNLFRHFNCLYPNFDSDTYEKGRHHNHGIWYSQFQKSEKDFINQVNRLIDFASTHNVNKIVLSYEGWLGCKELPERLKVISDTHTNIVFKFICYIRRSDSEFESSWKQWGLKKYNDIESYLPVFIENRKKITHFFRYFSDVFGDDSIIVRPYEAQQLPKGLLYDFLSCLGIDYDSFTWNKNEDTNAAKNHGFNMDVLEVMHLSREFIPDLHDNHMTDLFAELLGNKFQKQPFESLSILSPAQRLELINTNAPYEQEIARRYMNREDGRIFYDPLPNLDEPWQPYEGLTLEKFVPIVIQMIDRQDQMINDAKKFINDITLLSLIKQMKILTPLRKVVRSLRNFIAN